MAREPNVIEFTVQQIDNGWVVSARKSGHELAVYSEADENAVSERVKSELEKNKKPDVVSPARVSGGNPN